MIHYALRCAAGHEFDGWFASSAAFDSQSARGLVACTRCGSVHIDRGVMAPRIARSRAAPAPAPAGDPAAGTKTTSAPVPEATAAAPAMPAEMRAALMRLRHTVEQSCDFVGASFPDQARRMHHGEIAPRGIYGHSTEAEAAELREEGVPIASLPWVDRADG